MARGKTIDAVAAEVEQLLDVWDEYEDFSLGELKKDAVRTKLATMRGKRDEIEGVNTHLIGLRGDLGAMVKEMRQLITRMRSGFRAQYGPDSKQYEQAGGTRSSERGKRTTTKKTKGDKNGPKS